MRPGLTLCLLLGSALAGVRSQASVTAGAQIQKNFEERVQDYVKLRDIAREGLPKLKPTKSAGTIDSHEKELARRIRELRHGARRGDIFSPDIAAEFRRLIGSAMQGEEAARIRKSLRSAEPVYLGVLRVDHRYPDGLPLQSTPPTLLLNLPGLPRAMEYRIVGRALVLLDAEADLVVDFLPHAIPERRHAH